jgi:hypothetical protein
LQPTFSNKLQQLSSNFSNYQISIILFSIGH